MNIVLRLRAGARRPVQHPGIVTDRYACPLVADRTRATVFGEVADLYDRARPSYPAALIADVLTAAPPRPRVLEIRAGTGKATVLFAPHASEMVCLEPDPAMASVARSNCAGFPHVTIVGDRFEDWDHPGGGRFDLIISAQAWHWVDPKVGPRKAHATLLPGSPIALFWNFPLPDRNPLRDTLVEVYTRYAPEIAESSMWNSGNPGVEPTAEQAVTSMFTLDRRRYEWTATYRGREYADLLRTHGDHRMLPPEALDRLLDEVRQAVESAGDVITIEYEAILRLGRRVGVSD
jgi:SAM-dependent methyltransferase